jgi:hypothetical protein
MGLMTEHRTGNVVIVNETGAPIRAVSLIHKYSDVYKNGHSWQALAQGAKTEPFPVDYNIGLATTGRDWWLLAWVDVMGKTMYLTDPDNARALVDILELVAPLLVEVAGEIATSETGGWGGPVGELIISPFLNNESTVGFKQHILREEDALTTIRLTTNEVRWISPSGESGTGVATQAIPTVQVPGAVRATGTHGR